MNIFLSTVQLSLKSTDNIIFDCNSSKLFQTQIVDTYLHFNCFYKTVKKIDKPDVNSYFTGNYEDEAINLYNWKILKCNNDFFFHINYSENELFMEVLITLNLSEKTIFIDILPRKSSQLIFDPLFHPFGSLLMIYLSHFSSGFLIHASGIKEKDMGYMFTGVSGIGKSTMCKLWLKQGAIVINDDRLWVQKIENEWRIFSTPMSHYMQKPIMSNLSKIFLLSQSPENYISQISNNQGALRIMTNCIQHLFDKKMTTSHLDTILEMTNKIPVYELGFKPTDEIVYIIRNTFTN